MESSYLIKLSLVLYKVTESIPDGEPLRSCIREKANSILENLILLSKSPAGLKKEQQGQTETDIESLLAYFKIAGEQEWANKEYFMVLAKEYKQIKREIEQSLEKKKVEKPQPSNPTPVSKPVSKPSKVLAGKKRCKEILRLLENRDSLQVKDLQEVFPNVTKRTLRRDFEFLLNQGLVKRVGERSDTEYRLG